MSNAWYGTTDAEIRNHGMTFSQAASFYQGTIPLTAGEVDLIENAYIEFNTAYETHLLMQEEAQSARATKDQTKQAMIEVLQQLSKKVRTSNAATEAIILDFGMRPISPPSFTAPTEPTELIAIGFANGRNELRWKRNGNIPGTTYLIQAKEGGTGAWKNVGVSTSTKFVHEGVTPGEFMLYRVRAQRRGESSPYSETASVYGSQLSVAA